MPNPTAAMLVIGDEILSGRTKDTNTNYLACALTEAAIDLKEARVVSDEHDRIAEAVQVLSKRYDHVFTSGGIGPTHDDITADAIGAAFGVNVDIRDDARDLLAAHYKRQGMEFNDARKRMARIPDGATLIENPVSIAPGFSIGNVHVMAGVPTVFHAMVATVLATLTGGQPLLSETLRVYMGEGDVAGPLGILAEANKDVSLGSYPFQKDGVYGSNLVVRGTDPSRLKAVIGQLAKVLGVEHE
ncbi:molybdenum cofactor synthesis domain-containing protein [Litoreibacter halocynthiae]|uniref:Molybdenum cofactor synthesis domain-containing protein n=1 Tax=Litoreibacter halocynthiae TaxID=1242689 RepID=A0A4R7LCI7_9RHOB|nr:molybdopterin-binding protein [Litoreibacter halocynthiae]TDT73238.1 molybdenum cofactor synthesis domain-containing protein [Litoreibacter halocynthiae]